MTQELHDVSEGATNQMMMQKAAFCDESAKSYENAGYLLFWFKIMHINCVK